MGNIVRLPSMALPKRPRFDDFHLFCFPGLIVSSPPKRKRLAASNRPEKETSRQESFPRKDFTPGIVPKKRLYARNRCGKTTLGQITPGRTIRRPGVDAAFVPPITTLVKSPFRPDCLAARKLRRGPGAARDLGRNPRAGAAGETMEIRGSETHGGLLQRGAGHKYCQSAHWKITTYGDAGHRSCQG